MRRRTLEEFKENLYQYLRRYQDGEFKGESTVVGKLDQPLTQLYDRICLAAKDLVGRRQ